MLCGVCDRRCRGRAVSCNVCGQEVCKDCHNEYDICTECIERQNEVDDRREEEVEQRADS